MKIGVLFGIVCLHVLLVCSLSAESRGRFTDEDTAIIKTYLNENFAESNVAIVIGLLDENGSQVLSAGKLDNQSNQEVNGDTVFEIGSVTKVFTSLLALDMDRRGEWKLSDPLSKHLPEQVKVPVHGEKEILILHLAAQDSGLPFHPENLAEKPTAELSLSELQAASNAYTVEDLYSFLSHYQLPSEPGVNFQYSNVGMGLLGHAMERRTDTDYESLVIDRICRPLKMDSTCIRLSPELKGRLAGGHDRAGMPVDNLQFQVLAPAGSLLSTANDLLKFMSANLGFTHSDLSPSLNEMQVVRHKDAPRFGNTAIPWFDERVYQPAESELLGHGGGGFGYLAFIGFDKVQRRAVVVLSNQIAVNASGIGWAILQRMPLSKENVAFLVREVVGLGFMLDPESPPGMLRITRIYPNSPASDVSLSSGLVIQRINGTALDGKTVQESIGMMAGPAGTIVSLEIFDPERKETKTVDMVRRSFITSLDSE